MNDSELIDLAAKAAGLWDYKNDCVDIPWSPLTNDGDALRLAVKLGICLGPNFDGDAAVAFSREGRNICEAYSNDRCAATRRAIVRAAAEIGRKT